jgi:hypothetical protein
MSYYFEQLFSPISLQLKIVKIELGIFLLNNSIAIYFTTRIYS